MLNVDSLDKGVGLVSPKHFAYILSIKIEDIIWQIVWLPLFLEMLGNMCIVIICFPVGDVINFEIN